MIERHNTVRLLKLTDFRVAAVEDRIYITAMSKP